MPAPDAPPAVGLAATIASIDGLLQALESNRDSVFTSEQLDQLYQRTGIQQDRILSLLDGTDDPEQESLTAQDRFRQRLLFLRETRRKPDGKRYTLDEMAQGTDMSHGNVHHLLTGRTVAARLEHGARMEAFFGMEAGFLHATDRHLLCKALQTILEQLTLLALMKQKDVSQLVMRSIDAGGETSLGMELRKTLVAALSRPDCPDPEAQAMRELTDDMMSLPTPSKRRILPIVRGLLGLERPDGADPGSAARTEG